METPYALAVSLIGCIVGIVKAMCLFFIFFVTIGSLFLNSTQRVYPIDTIIHHSREKRYKHRPRTGERNIFDVPCVDYSKSIPVLIETVT